MACDNYKDFVLSMFSKNTTIYDCVACGPHGQSFLGATAGKRRDSCLLTGPPRGTSTAVARQLCICLFYVRVYVRMYVYKCLLYVQLDTYVSDKRQTFIFQLVAYEMVNIIACKTFRNLMIKNTIVSKC